MPATAWGRPAHAGLKQLVSETPDTVNPALNRHMGRRLAERREALGISVDGLAAQAGISAQLLRDMQAGETRVPPEILFELCRTLNVEPLYFFPDPATTFGSG